MSSADIIVNLPRPSPDQEVSPDLSPTSYIHHPAMLEIIRRNAGIQIGANMHKRCYLEPPSIAADQSIAQYYDRIHESMSKETISVRMPGQGILKLLNDGQVRLFSFVRLEYKLTGLGMQESLCRRHGRVEISKKNNLRANRKTRSAE